MPEQIAVAGALRGVNLDVLGTFVAVARLGSMTHAATALGYAQPTVSQHVMRLEMCVRQQLFLREGGRLSLTEPGRRLLPIARIIVNAMSELTEGR